MNLAPVAFFVYNRLEHAKQSIRALQKNHFAPDTDLIIFSDGAKGEKDSEKVRIIRDYIRTIDGFKSIKIVERGKNLGLAQSFIQGITEVVTEHGKIIVLEDDNVTAPYFLQFMNDGLNEYERDSEVACITGYVYPVKGKLPETFFIRGAEIWGWATWSRAWSQFEENGKVLLDELEKKNLIYDFNYRDAAPFDVYLRHHVLGKNDSWAARWQASAYVKGLLTLYPGKPLSRNIGRDATGVHCETDDDFDVVLNQSRIGVSRLPLLENKAARKQFEVFFRRAFPKDTFLKKVSRKLKKIGRVISLDR